MTSSGYVLSVQRWLVDLGLLSAAQDFWSVDALAAMRAASFISNAVDPNNLPVLRAEPEGYRFDSEGCLQKHEEVPFNEDIRFSAPVKVIYDSDAVINVEKLTSVEEFTTDGTMSQVEAPVITPFTDTTAVTEAEIVQKLPHTADAIRAAEQELTLPISVDSTPEEELANIKPAKYRHEPTRNQGHYSRGHGKPFGKR